MCWVRAGRGPRGLWVPEEKAVLKGAEAGEAGIAGRRDLSLRVRAGSPCGRATRAEAGGFVGLGHGQVAEVAVGGTQCFSHFFLEITVDLGIP